MLIICTKKNGTPGSAKASTENADRANHANSATF